MNIAQTSHHYYPHSGGTETVVKTVVDALALRNNTVHVFSDYEDLKQLKDEKNILYHGIRLKRVGKFRFPASGYWKEIEDSDCDILHVQGQRVWSSDYLYTHLNRIKSKKVFTAHGYYQLIYGGMINRLYYGRFMPSFLNKFDKVICLTDVEKRISERMFPKITNKITVLPNPVDFKRMDEISLDRGVLEKYNLVEKNFFIHAGGLQRNKNIEFILEAMKGLKIPLVLCGNIPDTNYFEEIKLKATQMKVEIKVLGSINEDELFSLIRKARFYLSGSIFEGFGISMVEASYLGTMVIANNAGIATELQEIGGLKIANSPEQMRKIIDSEMKIEDHEQLKESLKKRFSKDEIIDRLIKLYGELI